MKVINGFLIFIGAIMLLMIPISRLVYDYRTMQRTDTFNITLGATTNTTTVLLKPVWTNDTATVSYLSSIAEAPFVASYNGTTRELVTAGLTANATRSLAITYDTAALTSGSTVDTFASKVDFLWLAFIVLMPVAGIGAIVIAAIKNRRS